MNYRKLYVDMVGEPIDISMDIHHIDGDRKNQDIKNLVAIPVTLHKHYHRQEQEIRNLVDAMLKKPCSKKWKPDPMVAISYHRNLFEEAYREIVAHIRIRDEKIRINKIKYEASKL